MPRRYYICDDCNYNFDITQRFEDPILKECPKCKGKVYQDLVGIHTSVISEPKTIGQLAERNSKKLGKECVDMLEKKRKEEMEANKEIGYQKIEKITGKKVKRPKKVEKEPWFGKLSDDKSKKIFESADPTQAAKKYILEGN